MRDRFETSAKICSAKQRKRVCERGGGDKEKYANTEYLGRGPGDNNTLVVGLNDVVGLQIFSFLLSIRIWHA